MRASGGSPAIATCIFPPQPARYFDSQVKNGFGVMMDDVIAAGYTILTIAVFKAFLPF